MSNTLTLQITVPDTHVYTCCKTCAVMHVTCGMMVNPRIIPWSSPSGSIRTNKPKLSMPTQTWPGQKSQSKERPGSTRNLPCTCTCLIWMTDWKWIVDFHPKTLWYNPVPSLHPDCCGLQQWCDILLQHARQNNTHTLMLIKHLHTDANNHPGRIRAPGTIRQRPPPIRPQCTVRFLPWLWWMDYDEWNPIHPLSHPHGLTQGNCTDCCACCLTMYSSTSSSPPCQTNILF